MARNKRLQDREEKRIEIINAARKLLLKEGYESTSMTKLAAAAGVAPNTIYWYFKDKDEVLVSVLNTELKERMAEYTQRTFTDWTERLLWIVNQFELTSRLVSTVHARLLLSPEINTWHDRFHTICEAMAKAEIHRTGIATDNIEAQAKIWAFTIEGLLAHQITDDQKRAICATLVGNRR